MVQRRPDLRLVPALPDASDDGAAADAALMTRVREGDRGAAAAFHDRVRPPVERTVARLLGRRDTDAEDVIQQILIELVTSAGRYRGDAPLDAWVRSVAAHTVYKHIRRRRTERGIFGGSALEGARAMGGADAVMRSALGRVLTLLSGMNEDRAWAFVLHDVLGFDLTEVAGIQGITEAAAQSRVSRGRRELHARIAAEPELVRVFEDREGAS